MVYVPKVEPPLDEIEIEYYYNRGHRANKPYVTISMECLEAILRRETLFIAAEDIHTLLADLCRRALQADIGDVALTTSLLHHYDPTSKPAD
jgi:hypothetical protein